MKLRDWPLIMETIQTIGQNMTPKEALEKELEIKRSELCKLLDDVRYAEAYIEGLKSALRHMEGAGQFNIRQV